MSDRTERIDAWRACAQRYFERRVRDPHAVDDLVQETCVRAWLSQRDRCASVTPAWVIGISWRVLARHRRRDVRTPVHYVSAEASETLRHCPATSRERLVRIADRTLPISRVLAVLERSVESMPARWRGLLEHRLEGASLRTIASRTGLSVNVIKLRLYRGRRALREAILASLREEEAQCF